MFLPKEHEIKELRKRGRKGVPERKRAGNGGRITGKQKSRQTISMWSMTVNSEIMQSLKEKKLSAGAWVAASVS